MDSNSFMGWSHLNYKRTHGQMENDRSPSFPTLRPSAPPTPPRRIDRLSNDPQDNHLQPRTSLVLSGMPHHFPVDGLDFGRQISTSESSNSSQNQPTFIDLTSDSEPSPPQTTPMQTHPAPARASRPPRFGGDREIIDLSTDTPPQPQRTTLSSNESPEVEFISAREVPPANRRPPPAFDLTADDDLQITAEYTLNGDRNRQGANPDNGFFRGLPFTFGTILEPSIPLNEVAGRRHTAQDLEGQHRNRERATRSAQMRIQRIVEQQRRNRVPGPPRMMFGPPRPPARDELQFDGFVAFGDFDFPDLDFGAVAFDIETGRQGQRTPDPTYSAPSPAGDGFTRSPEEDEVLICPNCRDELCTGETELKRQVWIIRACGHVYCGECTEYRSKSRRKGKETIQSKPFKQCVVEGCGKSVMSKKTMLQLFL